MICTDCQNKIESCINKVCHTGSPVYEDDIAWLIEEIRKEYNKIDIKENTQDKEVKG